MECWPVPQPAMRIDGVIALGKFGLLTIKESYEYDDIDRTINLNDIISYKKIMRRIRKELRLIQTQKKKNNK